jgi:phospholipid-binding lipoprotein MlaA
MRAPQSLAAFVGTALMLAPTLLAPASAGAALMLAALALTGCASQPKPANSADAADAEQVNDPYENTNRFFYRVNDAIDTYSLKPLAQGYVYITPQPVRTGVHNTLDNLGFPILFANDVAQANPKRAGTTFMRFIINSTAGVLGVFDVAKELGYREHDTDFGITLALWGVPEGPFLYLPIIGPSSPRAVTGFAVDQGLDPFAYVPHGIYLRTFAWAKFGLGAIDTRSRYLTDLDKVKQNALDPYATFRSLYRQNTQSQVDTARTSREQPTTPPDWTPAAEAASAGSPN